MSSFHKPVMLDRSKSIEPRPLGRLNFPRPKIIDLSNGVRLYLINYGDLPILTLGTAVEGGTNDLNTLKKVLAFSLMLNVAQCGSSKLSSQQFSELMDFNGAFRSVGSSGHYSGYSLSVLSSRLDNILYPFIEMMVAPAFDQDDFLTQRAMMAQKTAQNLTRVSYWSSKMLNRMLYGTHNPDGEVGSTEMCLAIEMDQIKKMFNLWRRGRQYVFAAGKIDDRTEQTIIRAFESMPSFKRPGLELNIRPYQPLKAQIRTHMMPESLQSSVSMGVNVPFLRDNPDYIPLRIAVTALGGYFGSRLTMSIREEKGYTYGISAALEGALDGTSVRIGTQCDPKYKDAVIDEVRAEIKRLVEHPLDKDELSRLKNFMTTAIASQLEMPASVIDQYKQTLIVGAPEDYNQKQLDAINDITPERISELIQKYVPVDELRIAVATPW